MRDHLGAPDDLTVLPVSFAPPAAVQEHREYFHWPWVIASDASRGLYRAFGLGRAPLWRLYGPRAVLNDLRLRLTGGRMGPALQRDVAQLGGDFVLDAAGVLRWAWPSRGPEDRPPIAVVLEALRAAR